MASCIAKDPPRLGAKLAVERRLHGMEGCLRWEESSSASALDCQGNTLDGFKLNRLQGIRYVRAIGQWSRGYCRCWAEHPATLESYHPDLSDRCWRP